MIPLIQKCLLQQNRSHLHHHPLCYSISALFFSSLQTSEVPTAEYLIAHHDFSPKTASKASTVIPFLKNPQKCDSVISYLTQSGFSKAHLEKFISNFPKGLSANRTTIEPKVEVLFEAGFSSSEVADLVSNYPWILSQNTKSSLESTIREIRNILGSNEAILKVIRMCSWKSLWDLEKNVKPNIEYLESLGVEFSHIQTYFGRYPRIFLVNPESLVEKVRRVEKMGFDMKSRMLMEAIRVMSSMTLENWETKLNVFREIGYSEDQILSEFRRFPQVFCTSEQKIKEAIRVFVSEGEVDLPYLVRRSELLTFSINGRVNPRLRVIKTLQQKELVLKRPNLSTLVMISHKKFMAKFVIPYSKELGDDLVASFTKLES